MQAVRAGQRRANRIDLNLVRVFVAIFETRSVSLAANRLFVTQPTISYGLAALRRILQDALFVRTREGMLPTAQAQQMYAEFIGALARIDGVFEGSMQFDPSQTTRRFAIAMSDIGELVFLPPLLPAFMSAAPRAELEVIESSTPDLARRLATGEINSVVGNLPSLMNECRSEVLFTEGYVCLLSKRHSSIKRKLTRDAFANAKHVLVTTNFSGHNQVEEALQKNGVSRRITLQIPHFAILARLIATTDLIVILPSRVAKLLVTYEPLRWADIPVAIPTFEVRQYWNAQDDQNPASKWLRTVISESLRAL